MKKYNIPVIYQMWGLVQIEAPTLEDALTIALNHADELPLPDGAYYIEDSYEIDIDGVNLHNN